MSSAWFLFAILPEWKTKCKTQAMEELCWSLISKLISFIRLACWLMLLLLYVCIWSRTKFFTQNKNSFSFRCELSTRERAGARFLCCHSLSALVRCAVSSGVPLSRWLTGVGPAWASEVALLRVKSFRSYSFVYAIFLCLSFAPALLRAIEPARTNWWTDTFSGARDFGYSFHIGRPPAPTEKMPDSIARKFIAGNKLNSFDLSPSVSVFSFSHCFALHQWQIHCITHVCCHRYCVHSQ